MKPPTTAGIVVTLIGIAGLLSSVFVFAIGNQPTGYKLALAMGFAVVLCVGAGLLIAGIRKK